MSADRFAACLAETLRHEGGWANHPRDPGGATMRGVTLATFRAHFGAGRTARELRAISHAQLQQIYRAGYWTPIGGDSLPAGVDLVAFDAAVNSGPARGVRWLQGALGVRADGRRGPATDRALAHAAPRALIEEACELRLRWLRGLETWPTFGRGWERRVRAVRAAALAMADRDA